MLEITVHLKAKAGTVLFDSFANNCDYWVSFDSSDFKRVAPFVALSRSSQEKDWVRLDTAAGRDFAVSQRGMTYSRTSPKTAVVKLRARFRNGDEWHRYELVSPAFDMK